MASEPLCGVAERWTAIPTDTICALTAKGLAMTPLKAQIAA
jgi:glutamine amidotransferase